MTKRKKVEYKMLEPLDPKEVDRAFDEWRNEDDGTEDYPSLGEVLAVRFGAEQGQADNAALRARLAAANGTTVGGIEAELAACREALEMVEFLQYEAGWHCPWCKTTHRYKDDPYDPDEYPTGAEHAPNCPRQLALNGQRGAQLAALLAAVGETLADFKKWQRTTKDGRDIQQVFQPLYKAWYAVHPPEAGS